MFRLTDLGNDILVLVLEKVGRDLTISFHLAVFPIDEVHLHEVHPYSVRSCATVSHGFYVLGLPIIYREVRISSSFLDRFLCHLNQSRSRLPTLSFAQLIHMIMGGTCLAMPIP